MLAGVFCKASCRVQEASGAGMARWEGSLPGRRERRGLELRELELRELELRELELRELELRECELRGG